MTHFRDLLQARAGLTLRERQESATRSFPVVVAGSPFKLWSPDHPIASQGTRLLIGVATYSEPDLKLLDLVGEALERGGENTPIIEVFNTLDCHSHADFERYIPGIGKVFQTPAVGVWQNGVLVTKASGRSARDVIRQMCDLDPSSIQRLWN